MQSERATACSRSERPREGEQSHTVRRALSLSLSRLPLRLLLRLLVRTPHVLPLLQVGRTLMT